MLFYNHQLNYDEAVRRLQYWSTQTGPRAMSAIKMLATVLERERSNLYFEPKEKKIVGIH